MNDTTLQWDQDAAWRKDAERNGWTLPPKAVWPLRLPGVRFIRAAWMDYRVSKASSQWASVGIGLGSRTSVTFG